MYIIRKCAGVAFGNLKHRPQTIHHMESKHRNRHLCQSLKMRRESAAAEIFIIGPAPVCRIKAIFNIFLGHIPPLLHPPLCRTCAVKGSSSRVNQVNNTVFSLPRQLLPCNALHRIGAPISSHIVETRGTACKLSSNQHCNTIAYIILRSESKWCLFPVPIKRRCHNRFGKISVGKPVCPHPLPLKSSGNSIAPQRFLFPSDLRQTKVSENNNSYDNGHFSYKFPVFIGRNYF